MDANLLIFIAIIAVVGIIAYKITKKIVKAVFFILLMLIIVFGFATLFLYLDLRDIQKNANSERIYLIEENNTAYCGMTTENQQNSLDKNELAEYSSYLPNEEYGKILQTKYKAYIISTKAIDSLGDPIDFGDFVLPKEAVLSAIKSETPSEEFLLDLKNGTKIFLRNDSFKEYLCQYMVGKIAGSTLIMITEFKHGNIVVYPQTAIFKSINLIPLSFIESAIEDNKK